MQFISCHDLGSRPATGPAHVPRPLLHQTVIMHIEANISLKIITEIQNVKNILLLFFIESFDNSNLICCNRKSKFRPDNYTVTPCRFYSCYNSVSCCRFLLFRRKLKLWFSAYITLYF